MRQYEAIIDFDGQQPEDLSFTAGEILTIIDARYGTVFRISYTRGSVPMFLVLWIIK